MRKISFIILLLLVFAVPGMTGEFTSLAEAKAQALASNKPLLIDFMTTW